jgi:glucose-6-phosphate dehydrogenase assembly protein OpcA
VAAFVSTAAPMFNVRHASGLHAVARQLAAMHQEMLRTKGEQAGDIRLSVLTLVAACIDMESADLASQTVGLIAESHPARAIIIVAERDGEAAIEADISLQCADGGRGEICAEQVRLHVRGQPALHLNSVVTPLLVPDVPVFLWLVGGPPLEQAFGDDALAVCDRLIVDSGAYADPPQALATLAAALAAHPGEISLADIAWARSRMFRELIAQAFDAAELRALIGAITAVDISCSGREVSAQAWLLAGWLASRLGWPADGGPEVRTGARPAEGTPRRDLVSVRLEAGDRGRVTVERTAAGTIAVTVEAGGVTTSRTVPWSSPDSVHLVGGLLEEDRVDPVYPAALARAAGLARR